MSIKKVFLWKNRCCERVYNKRIGVIYHHGSRVMRFQKGQQLCSMGFYKITRAMRRVREDYPFFQRESKPGTVQLDGLCEKREGMDFY